MLVVAGRPVELDAHIERLNSSLATLYGVILPETAPGAIFARAQGIEHGKLRITAVPRRGAKVALFAALALNGKPGLNLRIASEDIETAAVFPGPARSISLRTATVAGGLGEHKWADRRLLEQIEATFPPRQLALLLDADDSVLEASRASVFRVEGERLATPPSDGRILPSIARRQAIEVAREAGIEVRERLLSVADLQGSEVFLTGSVRGVEPVDSINGIRLPPPGTLSARVGADLKRRWLRAPQEEPAAVGAGA